MKLFCAFVLLLLLFECSGEPAVHLGCFTSQPVEESRNYKVQQALSFKDGMNVCNHRLTIYMAVQYEESYPEDNLFYCGNDLLEMLDKADNSSCHPCVQDQGLMCGGPARVSLYKLRDLTPLTVLIGTSANVLKVTEGNSNSMLEYGENNHVYGLDFNMMEDEIVYVTKNDIIKRLRYNYLTHSYLATTVLSRSSSIHDLTVNWLNDDIYWAYYDGGDIYVVDQHDSSSSTIVRVYRTNFQKDLTIDPLSSLLFFVENFGQFYSYSLKTNTTKPFKRYGRLFLTHIERVSVDVQKKTIYAVGKTTDDSSLSLVQVDYEDSRGKLMYKGPAMTDIRALDVFNGIAVWIDQRSSQYIVYTCKLAAKCREVTQLYHSTQTLYDLKIYHPDKQKSIELDKPKSTSQTTSERKEITSERIATENNKQTTDKPKVSNGSSSEMIVQHEAPSDEKQPRNHIIVNNIDHDHSILYFVQLGGFLLVLLTILISVVYFKIKLNSAIAKAGRRPAELKTIPCENNYEMISHDPLRTGRLLD